MEFIVGPVLALLVAMKFTVYRSQLTARDVRFTEREIKDLSNEITELTKRAGHATQLVAELENALNDEQNKVKELNEKFEEFEKGMPKKLLATVSPVAKAIQKLNTQVGIY